MKAAQINAVIVVIFALSFVHGSDIVVENLKLFVDGTEFFIKAVSYNKRACYALTFDYTNMCYNPAPLGVRNMSASGDEGGGFCSVKYTPYGDWKSACFDRHVLLGV